MANPHTVPTHACPVCGRLANRASPADEDETAPPEAGDITVCIGCGTILLFDTCANCGELGLRMPTIEEAIHLEEHHQAEMREVAKVQEGVFLMLEQAAAVAAGKLN